MRFNSTRDLVPSFCETRFPARGVRRSDTIVRAAKPQTYAVALMMVVIYLCQSIMGLNFRNASATEEALSNLVDVRGNNRNVERSSSTHRRKDAAQIL